MGPASRGVGYSAVVIAPTLDGAPRQGDANSKIASAKPCQLTVPAGLFSRRMLSLVIILSWPDQQMQYGEVRSIAVPTSRGFPVQIEHRNRGLQTDNLQIGRLRL